MASVRLDVDPVAVVVPIGEQLRVVVLTRQQRGDDLDAPAGSATAA